MLFEELLNELSPEQAVGQEQEKDNKRPSPLVILIEQETKNNSEFRKVVKTTANSQIILMSVDPGNELGHEVHHDADQFFRIESGLCVFEFGKNKDTVVEVREGEAVLVPAGLWHNVYVPGNANEPCKFYTIYSPPTHKTIKINNKEIDIDDHNKE